MFSKTMRITALALLIGAASADKSVNGSGGGGEGGNGGSGNGGGGGGGGGGDSGFAYVPSLAAERSAVRSDASTSARAS